METPFFFNNGSYRLFGVLHEPEIGAPGEEGSTGERNIGVVFCDPLGEEKVISHRIMVNLARVLTKEGILCLRFDYMGSGDSDGTFEDSSVETMSSDIGCAVDTLRARSGARKIGLVGVRFGATVAVLAGHERPDVDFLILIAPVVNGKTYMNECLRSNVALQMAAYKKVITDKTGLIASLKSGQQVSIDGYQYTKVMYEQVDSVDLLDHAHLGNKRALIVEISKGRGENRESAARELFAKAKTLHENVEFVNTEERLFWSDGRFHTSRCTKVEGLLGDWLKRS